MAMAARRIVVAAFIVIGAAGLLACGRSEAPQEASAASLAPPAQDASAPVTTTPERDVAPQATTPSAPAESPRRSCSDEIGEEAAGLLASRCAFVSGATHPPCHPDNPCALAQDEIDRNCRFLDPEEVPECLGPTDRVTAESYRTARPPMPG